MLVGTFFIVYICLWARSSLCIYACGHVLHCVYMLMCSFPHDCVCLGLVCF